MMNTLIRLLFTTSSFTLLATICFASISADTNAWFETTITFSNRPLAVCLPAKYEPISAEHPLFTSSQKALGPNFRLAAGFMAKDQKTFLVFRENLKLRDYSYSPERWRDEIEDRKQKSSADVDWEHQVAKFKKGLSSSDALNHAKIVLSKPIENLICDETPLYFCTITLKPVDQQSPNRTKGTFSLWIESQIYVSYRRVAMISYSYIDDLNELEAMRATTKEIITKMLDTNPSNTAKTWGIE